MGLPAAGLIFFAAAPLFGHGQFSRSSFLPPSV